MGATGIKCFTAYPYRADRVVCSTGTSIIPQTKPATAEAAAATENKTAEKL